MLASMFTFPLSPAACPRLSPIAALAVVGLFALGSIGCEAQKQALPAPTTGAQKVHIETEPPGAQIVVDGIVLGPGPHDVMLNPGPHRFKANKNAYFPAEQRHTVSGEPASITLHLVKSH